VTTGQCACGGIIEAGAGELLAWHVRQHNRSDRHLLWSIRQVAPSFDVRIAPLTWTRKRVA
jgi:hypothetical protein